MRRACQLSLIVPLFVAAACGDTTVSPTSLRTASAAPSANKPSSGPADIPVVTTIFDADASGAPLIVRGDETDGSGFATYSPIGGVHNSLTSQVTDTWGIFIGNQTLRTVRLMLADAGLPFQNGYYSANVEIASPCFDQAGNKLNIQSLVVGQSYGNCNFIVDFGIGAHNPTIYKLAMGPRFDSRTGTALVTCTRAAGGLCTAWTIVPNDAAPNSRVAILTAGSGTTSLDNHLYTNSFRITVTE